MGLCSGKGMKVGGVTISIKTSLKINAIGVPNIDNFIDQCNELV